VSALLLLLPQKQTQKKEKKREKKNRGKEGGWGGLKQTHPKKTTATNRKYTQTGEWGTWKERRKGVCVCVCNCFSLSILFLKIKIIINYN
jgi:hypothetical protein